MDTRVEALGDRDLTRYSVCPRCNRKGKGVPLGDISCKAFTEREWRGNPACENCGDPMVLIYEVR